MSLRTKNNKPSKTRTVLYQFVEPFTSDPEPLMIKALEAGIITQYDDGRGDIPWFEGPPGKELRELKKTIQALSTNPKYKK